MTESQAEPTEELSEEQCWEFLAKATTGRLAVAIGDHPDIFPINHVVDDDVIVFRTDPGTKLAAAVLGTGVAYEVDHTDLEAGVAWSVGTAAWRTTELASGSASIDRDPTNSVGGCPTRIDRRVRRTCFRSTTLVRTSRRRAYCQGCERTPTTASS